MNEICALCYTAVYPAGRGLPWLWAEVDTSEFVCPETNGPHEVDDG